MKRAPIINIIKNLFSLGAPLYPYLPLPLSKNKQRLLLEYAEFDWAYAEIRTKATSIRRMVKKVEVLFLGSSHIACGIIPALIPKTTFNFGTGSQDLYTTRALYNFYRNRLPNLKLVVVGISPFTPGYNLEGTSRKDICACFKTVHGIPYPSVTRMKSLQKICGHIHRNKYRYIPNDCGYIRKERIFKNLDARVKPHLRENRRTPSQLFELEKLHQSIKKDNRDLCLITPPASPAYINAMPDRDELFKEVYKLCADRHIPIKDYYGDPEFTDQHFPDYDHLNYAGGEQLSSKVRDNIIARYL